MNLYIQPEPELTEQEKLLAAVIDLNHRIPVGFQIGLPLHLDHALAAAEKLFTEHTLPLREELIAELKFWRSHAEDGLKFANRCDQLMRRVIRTVDEASKARLMLNRTVNPHGTPGPARKGDHSGVPDGVGYGIQASGTES